MNEEILTAAEGADRLQQRWKKFGKYVPPDFGSELPVTKEDDDDEETPIYTCENCGDHEFQVFSHYETQQSSQESLMCTCGECDVAATIDMLVTILHQRVGLLDAEHRVKWDEWNEEVSEEEEVDRNIECDKCFSGADPNDWQSEELTEPDADVPDEFVEVRCAACGHEIEFGYSHQNQGGRIWPCESADFNPWKCFPEARFVSDWQRRGWLRPR